MSNVGKGKMVTLPTRQAMTKHVAAEIKLHNILTFSFAERDLLFYCTAAGTVPSGQQLSTGREMGFETITRP
jgi:hypothetical protein